VVTGWNLVPVLTNEVPLPGDGAGAISADDYFGTLRTTTGDAAWLKALTWNTSTQTWDSIGPGDTVLRTAGEKNPCTDATLAAAAVKATTEPCQSAAYTEVGGTATVFDNSDTVVMEEELAIGAGVWVWSTVDGVIIP